MARFIRSKTLVSAIRNAPDPFFGLWYNLNLYRGCQHGCIYCDSRSKCYGLGDLMDIRIKENAPELLEKELKSKRKRGTIGFGSMNDPYMPIEKEMQLSRNALEIMYRHRFPVHIITKSSLVCRDADLLSKIGKVYSAVTITITTPEDSVSKQIEPGAPVSSERFEALAELRKQGVYAGVCLMPVLPFITDNEQSLLQLVEKAAKSGAQYILIWTGMTLREGQREYFYTELDTKFPGLRELYQTKYGNAFSCSIPEGTRVWKTLQNRCRELNLPTQMKFYQPENIVQGKLFI